MSAFFCLPSAAVIWQGLGLGRWVLVGAARRCLPVPSFLTAALPCSPFAARPPLLPASACLQERRLKDLIKKHSEFISYPISLWTEKTVEKVGAGRVGCWALCWRMDGWVPGIDWQW